MKSDIDSLLAENDMLKVLYEINIIGIQYSIVECNTMFVSLMDVK